MINLRKLHLKIKNEKHRFRTWMFYMKEFFDNEFEIIKDGMNFYVSKKDSKKLKNFNTAMLINLIKNRIL